MNSIKLDKNVIITLGNTISEILHKSNIKTETTLNIKVDSLSFKKIDEDLYYRGNEKAEQNDFQPSDDEIIVKFSNLLIIIEKEK